MPTLHLSGEMSSDRVMERALALEGFYSQWLRFEDMLDPST